MVQISMLSKLLKVLRRHQTSTRNAVLVSAFVAAVLPFVYYIRRRKKELKCQEVVANRDSAHDEPENSCSSLSTELTSGAETPNATCEERTDSSSKTTCSSIWTWSTNSVSNASIEAIRAGSSSDESPSPNISDILREQEDSEGTDCNVSFTPPQSLDSTFSKEISPLPRVDLQSPVDPPTDSSLLEVSLKDLKEEAELDEIPPLPAEQFEDSLPGGSSTKTSPDGNVLNLEEKCPEADNPIEDVKLESVFQDKESRESNKCEEKMEGNKQQRFAPYLRKIVEKDSSNESSLNSVFLSDSDSNKGVASSEVKNLKDFYPETRETSIKRRIQSAQKTAFNFDFPPGVLLDSPKPEPSEKPESPPLSKEMEIKSDSLNEEKPRADAGYAKHGESSKSESVQVPGKQEPSFEPVLPESEGSSKREDKQTKDDEAVPLSSDVGGKPKQNLGALKESTLKSIRSIGKLLDEKEAEKGMLSPKRTVLESILDFGKSSSNTKSGESSHPKTSESLRESNKLLGDEVKTDDQSPSNAFKTLVGVENSGGESEEKDASLQQQNPSKAFHEFGGKSSENEGNVGSSHQKITLKMISEAFEQIRNEGGLRHEDAEYAKSKAGSSGDGSGNEESKGDQSGDGSGNEESQGDPSGGGSGNEESQDDSSEGGSGNEESQSDSSSDYSRNEESQGDPQHAIPFKTFREVTRSLYGDENTQASLRSDEQETSEISVGPVDEDGNILSSSNNAANDSDVAYNLAGNIPTDIYEYDTNDSWHSEAKYKGNRGKMPVSKQYQYKKGDSKDAKSSEKENLEDSKSGSNIVEKVATTQSESSCIKNNSEVAAPKPPLQTKARPEKPETTEASQTPVSLQLPSFHTFNRPDSTNITSVPYLTIPTQVHPLDAKGQFILLWGQQYESEQTKLEYRYPWTESPASPPMEGLPYGRPRDEDVPPQFQPKPETRETPPQLGASNPQKVKRKAPLPPQAKKHGRGESATGPLPSAVLPELVMPIGSPPRSFTSQGRYAETGVLVSQGGSDTDPRLRSEVDTVNDDQGSDSVQYLQTIVYEKSAGLNPNSPKMVRSEEDTERNRISTELSVQKRRRHPAGVELQVKRLRTNEVSDPEQSETSSNQNKDSGGMDESDSSNRRPSSASDPNTEDSKRMEDDDSKIVPILPDNQLLEENKDFIEEEVIVVDDDSNEVPILPDSPLPEKDDSDGKSELPDPQLPIENQGGEIEVIDVEDLNQAPVLPDPQLPEGGGGEEDDMVIEVVLDDTESSNSNTDAVVEYLTRGSNFPEDPKP